MLFGKTIGDVGQTIGNVIGNTTTDFYRLFGLSWENSILDYQSSIHVGYFITIFQIFWDWIAQEFTTLFL